MKHVYIITNNVYSDEMVVHEKYNK